MPHFQLTFTKVIDSSTAVPLLLAAEAHGATQLAGVCKFHIAVDLAQAEKHEQWQEVREAVRLEVVLLRQRMAAERALRQQARDLHGKIPCLLAPAIISIES